MSFEQADNRPFFQLLPAAGDDSRHLEHVRERFNGVGTQVDVLVSVVKHLAQHQDVAPEIGPILGKRRGEDVDPIARIHHRVNFLDIGDRHRSPLVRVDVNDEIWGTSSAGVKLAARLDSAVLFRVACRVSELS